MNNFLKRVGIKNPTFRLLTIQNLVVDRLIEPPLDGNHGELHPKTDDLVDSGIPFIMASDLSEGEVDFSSCNYITQTQAEKLRKGFAREGDVLLTHKATIGRTAIVQSNEYPYIMLTPQVTYYRVIDRSLLNNRYLRYFFESDFFQRTLELWAGSGSTRAYLGISAQRRLPVILPPIEIQSQIASILSAYDDLIENNKRRIAILEKMAEEIYREWFVRMRFPGHENVKFVKGVPEGWTVKKLDEVIEDIIDYRGITPAKLGFDWESGNEGVIALSALNVKDGELIKLADAKRVSRTLYDRWMRKKLKVFDILLTSEAPLGQVYMLFGETEYVLSQRLFAIRADNRQLPAVYLYHYFLFEIGKSQLAARATGSTVGGIRQSLLREVEVLLPERILLERYLSLTLPLINECHLLRLQINILTTTRDLLLPRLITGMLPIEKISPECSHLDVTIDESSKTYRTDVINA